MLIITFYPMDLLPWGYRMDEHPYWVGILPLPEIYGGLFDVSPIRFQSGWFLPMGHF